ncbi:MAG: hypothetical protein ACE5MM_02930, partial [Nitrospiraceae bacterium]
MRKLTRLTAVIALFAFGATPASAAVEFVDDSEKTTGDTTVTWDSSFRDLDYTEGDTVAFTADWTVDSGAAVFDSCGPKTHKGKGKGGTFTPKSKNDPVTGSTTCVEDTNAVDFKVTFDRLHCDKNRNTLIGNAHAKLYLWVAEDFPGPTDLLVGY